MGKEQAAKVGEAAVRLRRVPIEGLGRARAVVEPNREPANGRGPRASARLGPESRSLGDAVAAAGRLDRGKLPPQRGYEIALHQPTAAGCRCANDALVVQLQDRLGQLARVVPVGVAVVDEVAREDDRPVAARTSTYRP